MAQNTTITCAAGVWTLLTNSNVTALRACNLGSEGVWLMATAGATAPAVPANAAPPPGAVPLLPNQTLAADLTLAQLFPGVSGANRVYCFAYQPTRISVSHA